MKAALCVTRKKLLLMLGCTKTGNRAAYGNGICLVGFYYAGRGYTNRIEHATPREEVPTPTAILGQMTPNYRNRPWFVVSQSGRGTDVNCVGE